jgi:hypothetical protein
MELELREGWVEPELAAEFPELELTWAPLDGRLGRGAAEAGRRLRGLSDRYTGGRVIHMCQDPCPGRKASSGARSGSIPTATAPRPSGWRSSA